jgi:hypothetical protein
MRSMPKPKAPEFGIVADVFEEGERTYARCYGEGV